MESAASLLPCVVLESGGEVRSAVIWLHGLGADGNDFVPIVEELGLDDGVRFIFPHAPHRPITLNAGYNMRGWYDLASLSLTEGQDEAGIRASAAQVGALIEAQRAQGIPAERIVLAGFSQGGAIALHAGLRYPRRLAGILALSTYLPLADTLAAEASPANRDMPIFMAHGDMDRIVAPQYGAMSAEQLRAAGYPLTVRRYPMDHTVCAEEVRDIGAWLRGVLAG